MILKSLKNVPLNYIFMTSHIPIRWQLGLWKIELIFWENVDDDNALILT